MADPATTTVVGLVETLSKLWDRTVTFFSAVAVICSLLLMAGGAAMFFGVGDVAVLGPTFPWLIGIGIISGVIALAKIIERRLEKSMHLIPDDQQSFWHQAKQQDGRVFTQIVLQFRVTNLTRAHLLLADVSLRRPWLFGAKMTKQLATYSAISSDYSADYQVAPRATTKATTTLFVEKDLGKAGKHMRVVVDLMDQRGRKRRLKFRKLRCS